MRAETLCVFLLVGLIHGGLDRFATGCHSECSTSIHFYGSGGENSDLI